MQQAEAATQRHEQELAELQSELRVAGETTARREKRDANAIQQQAAKLVEEQAARKEAQDDAWGKQLDVLVAQKRADDAEKEAKKAEKVLAQLATPEAASSAGRPSKQALLIRENLLGVPFAGAPEYYRRQLEEARVREAQLVADKTQLIEAAEADRLKNAELSRLAVVGGPMKRTIQDVQCNSTKKKLKSLSYGMSTKQYLINVASLNIPPNKIQQFLRHTNHFQWPHLEEGKDYQTPSIEYLSQCGYLVGHQAETCAALKLAEGAEQMAGLDGSTKESQHVMNANFKIRTAADVVSGGHGEHVFPRGPTLSSKGGGKGGAVAQKDFLLETLDEAKKRLDEWREEYSPPLSADKIPDSKEVTHATGNTDHQLQVHHWVV
jgi:hypothetical protein